MKKILIISIAALSFFVSCTGYKSTTKGLENEAFLDFVGTPSKYPSGVSVNLDDKSSFNAEVHKESSSGRPKGKMYAIPSGNHVITVTNNNVVIYKKQMFLSSQETKQILLP